MSFQSFKSELHSYLSTPLTQIFLVHLKFSYLLPPSYVCLETSENINSEPDVFISSNTAV